MVSPAPRLKVSARALLFIAAAVVTTAAIASLHAAAWAADEGALDFLLRTTHFETHAAAPSEGSPKWPNSTDTKRWLAGRAALGHPVGHLGPKDTKRENFVYYDSLFFTALQFGRDAASLIEVGCSDDPFIKHLDWIDGRRVCVAPYFVVNYTGDEAHHEGGAWTTPSSGTWTGWVGDDGIERVEADFMLYVVPSKFDLLLCSQVVEHVEDPGAFVKKLIRSARTSIISVPYMWKDCGRLCNHITHKITYDMILAWSAPEVPVYRAIVKENKTSNNGMDSRIIVVFRPKNED